METIHDHAQAISQSLGLRIHAMRESRDWTLEMLAERTGFSKAYLSRVEGGDRQPSLVALSAIAKAFAVSIAALFEQPDERTNCVIVRGGSVATVEANGLQYVPLSGSTKPFNLQPIAVTVPADRGGSELYQHDGEEWLQVTEGKLRLSIGGAAHVLEVGDCAHFDSRVPHRLDALDNRDASVVLVSCPIPLTLNPLRQKAESEIVQFAG